MAGILHLPGDCVYLRWIDRLYRGYQQPHSRTNGTDNDRRFLTMDVSFRCKVINLINIFYLPNDT